MSVIRTNAAAALLGVSSNTLRSWESRFGYPMPSRTEGGHRQFDLTEIEALRQAHAETRDIASAISLVRQRAEGPSTPVRLCAAFAEFSAEKADRVIEESMAVRSVERTVETVLLPAIEAMSPGSPEYCFAWRYATGWLAAAQRVAPPATRDEGVLVFDASGPLDIDGLYTQALELFLRRSGLRVLTLPVDLDSTRVGTALRALGPQAMVLAGRNSCLEAIGRLVYATRQSGGELQVFDYRQALPDTGASTVQRIGPGPAEAVVTLREHLANVAHTYNGRPNDGATQTPFDTAARGGRTPRFASARAGDTQALA